MNKFYSVIWNATLGRYIVASELAQGRKKSKSSSTGNVTSEGVFTRKFLLTCILSTLATEKSFAIDREIDFFNPQSSAYSILSGPVNLITGGSNGFANITMGASGFKNTTLQQALDAGVVVAGADYISGDIFRLGNKGSTITFEDPITHNQTSVSVYDNAQMTVTRAADFIFPMSIAVGEHGQYVDTSLYSVQSGSVVDVNVGTTSANWMNNAANRLAVIMKGSQADVTTSAVFNIADNGTLNYNSKTVAELGYVSNNNSNSKYAASFIGGFKGQVASKIGSFVVNDLESFQQYNTALQQAISAGSLKSTDYDTQLELAYDKSLKQVYVKTPIPDSDAINMNVDRGRVAFIKADGSGANINISQDANIQMFRSDASLVRLLNGATLTNLGTIGTVYNSLRGAYVVFAKDSQIHNEGVIDAGTNADMSAFNKYTSSGFNIGNGEQVAINASGTSTVLNNGVINVAPRQDNAGSTGVITNDTTQFTNNGNINLAALAQPSSANGNYKATGVVLQSKSSFDNNGQLYIGRLAQRSVSDVTSDVAVTSLGTLGVSLLSGGTLNNNVGGTITIGTQTQGATAISAVGSTSVVNQNGIVNVNGRMGSASNASSKNIGISSSSGAQQITNSGTINLSGINSVGMQVLTNSAATNNGDIIVNQGVDPATKTANYGIWSEGAGANVTHSGTVELKGDRAIGVHARNKGVVTLEGAGKVAFEEGENQIGYYVYGAGSSIKDNSIGSQNVSTKGSTLYRIDGGSSFTGSADSTSVMNASGENSTLLLVTGKSEDGKTISKLNTGKMVLNVDAAGATAVKVEGGAQGVLDQGVMLALTAKNATAGIVDGNSTTITGTAGATGASQLTSYATLDNSNAASDAMGYIARNKGTLIHKGSLNFTADNSTGVLVDGGNLENSSSITVNGIAVDIVGGDSKVTNTGTVKATGGTAAYRLKDGASLALSGQGTTIAQNGAHGVLIEAPAKTGLLKATGDSQLTVTDATISVTGTGNAIENGAEVAGIRLNNAKLNVEQGAGIRTGAELGTSNSGVITVSGSGAGIALKHADGSTTTADLNLLDSDGLTINVTGANGSGIVTNTSGDVKNGTAINVTATDGGSALVVGGTTANVVQSGALTSKSLTKEVVNLNNGKVSTFVNNGSIKANSAIQVAVASNSGAGMTFTNNAGGNIVGQVNLQTGNNTVNLNSGSTGTDFTTGAGRDIFNLKDVTAQETSIFTSLNAGAGADDVLNLDNSAYVLENVNALTGFETINLTNGSTFTEQNTLLALGDAVDDASGTTFNIDTNSILALNNTQDVALNSHLKGSGTVKTDLANKAFSFTDNNKGDAFAGTLELTNSSFALEGINAQALSDANLKLSAGSVATVGAGTQTIGGLNFNGGTAKFGALNPGMLVAENTVHTTNSLDISGQGVVAVSLTSAINDNPLPANHLSLMEQDDAQTLVKLADSAASVSGSGGNLELRDQDDNVISDSVTVDITQQGATVAKGTWDYRLTSGDNADGLYINYGLKQVELQSVGDDALVLNSNGKSAPASDLSAKVIGSGDLHIDSPTGAVSLSNLDNSYTGQTVVNSGTLQLANDGVLGQTRDLRIEENAAVEMQGHSQQVGALNTAAASQLQLSAGSQLTISDTQRVAGDTDGGTINAGTLNGSGKLVIDPSVLTVNGANTGFSGDVTLEGGSQALLNNVSGFGDTGTVNLATAQDRLTFAKQLASDAAAVGLLSKQLAGVGAVELKDNSDITLTADNSAFTGEFAVDSGSDLRASAAENLGDADVVDNGVVHLTADSDWLLSNVITGTGSLEKLGNASLIIDNEQSYNGTTDVQSGRLILGSNERANGKLSGNGGVNIASGATLGGNGEVTGPVNNKGTLAALNALSGYENQAASTLTVGDLHNQGEIHLAGADVGNTLIVNGNYSSDNGLLALNTVLGDDNSLTDKLVVTGDTSGSTRVQVTNLGGNGALTEKGIEVVHVGGASEGDFALQGRAVAGAYDYFLNKGQADGNWYLASQAPTPLTPDNPDTPVSPDTPVDPANPDNPIVRPEAGAYTANIAAANTMFITTLHDRLGETNYVDALTGETHVTSMWMRNIGGHTGFRDDSGQLKTQSNRYVLQMGGDIAQWGSEGENRTHLGVMAGYGNNHSNTRSSVTNYRADGSVNGYSVGIYGTWLANEAENTGAYVDSWAQYNWFNNSVKGDELSSESYKSDGLTASVETGYTFKTGEFKGSKGTTNKVYVQPQAQAIWMGVKADQHTEANGTHVESQGDGNVMTRLGVRAYLKSHNQIDNGKDREFEPFIEANWIHNTNNFGVVMNDVSSSMTGTKNIAELKVGVEGQINNNLNVWGNVTNQVGDKGYSDASAMIGIKYNFK
ncbi:autotransporter outer membrane beta-barrel domain-containing protein [Buttiauxella agrestis]|uniref:autotransporter outer membrane beta-barrel domain-containing protein n=1 Tax=Buttiauxella agrestis TaxID=82977 RepID=UPI00156167AD|nr:autotransporter outer membrane beta-barrel domain-containing protein [Buttiauxella agrestis]BCG09059.1 autotransporter outer membrane beta-barrel domain-containing protein [Buttiauxella agrestis]